MPFHAEKGFREGCPSSPGWHVEHRVLSKNPFAGHWQWQNDDLIEINHLFILLFADDATALRRKSEVNTIETLAADVLKAWGETVHLF